MKTKTLIVGSGIVVLGIFLWYVFRPELLFVNARVKESFPGPGTEDTTVLARGLFHDVAHETKGAATVHRLEDGTRVLRLTGFETSNGPDVHVYLVAAADAIDSETVTEAGFVDLGSLKGNVGDQNYEVPEEIDLAEYRAVTIWCRRFGVNFGTAGLEAAK